MKSKKKIVIFSSCAIIIIALMALYPSIYENYCKLCVYDGMKDMLQNIYSGNIGIITVTQHDGINGYSAGESGVIFDKKNERYYALTAYHVIKDADKILIQTSNSETLNEYRENNPSRDRSSLEDYYNTKIMGRIEYTCEESDLAIICFECDEDLAVVSVSDEIPEKNDKIMVIHNSEGDFIQATYGRILSKNLTTFDADDGQSKNVVLKHSAYVTPGSSGGAVINDKMNLVGINIGGGTDFLGRFKYGVLIPCDQVQNCIISWQENSQ